MPQPPAYIHSFSFTDEEADAPTGRPSGVAMDGEFDAIAATLRTVLANLVKLQRDDGAVKNGVITMDALSPAVVAMFAAASGWSVRGAWVTATAYVRSDIVANGTGTFIAAVDHVAADFATDLAAGRWVLLFDSAGTTPADGSVTTPKLADGAVTVEKLGFDELDLTGSFRAQGGLAAGTAPKGALLHAKAAAGAVYGKVERTTDAQGAVGYQIIGPAGTWTLEEASGTTNLQLRFGAEVVMSAYAAVDQVDFVGAVRAVSDPAANAGCSISYSGGVGLIFSFNADSGQWSDLSIEGKDIYLRSGGILVAKATSTYIDALVELRQNGSAVGYKGIPQVIDSDAHTILTAENGQHIYSENVAGQTITLPEYHAVNFAPGTDWVLIIINDGASPITLQGATAAVQMRLVGTSTVSQARIIAPGGWATVKLVKQNRYFVGGQGVS